MPRLSVLIPSTFVAGAGGADLAAPGALNGETLSPGSRLRNSSHGRYDEGRPFPPPCTLSSCFGPLAPPPLVVERRLLEPLHRVDVDLVLVAKPFMGRVAHQGCASTFQRSRLSVAIRMPRIVTSVRCPGVLDRVVSISSRCTLRKPQLRRSETEPCPREEVCLCRTCHAKVTATVLLRVSPCHLLSLAAQRGLPLHGMWSSGAGAISAMREGRAFSRCEEARQCKVNRQPAKSVRDSGSNLCAHSSLGRCDVRRCHAHSARGAAQFRTRRAQCGSTWRIPRIRPRRAFLGTCSISRGKSSCRPCRAFFGNTLFDVILFLLPPPLARWRTCSNWASWGNASPPIERLAALVIRTEREMAPSLAWLLSMNLPLVAHWPAPNLGLRLLLLRRKASKTTLAISYGGLTTSCSLVFGPH